MAAAVHARILKGRGYGVIQITVKGEQFAASAATREIKAIVNLVVKGAGVDNPNPVLPAGTCLNCVITVAGRPGAHDVGAAILQVLADGRGQLGGKTPRPNF